MTASTIQAIPMTYRGTRFRSTLEADWAATFDEWGWYWEYEPMPVSVDGGPAYLCDFYLPALDTWCEVKGPHNERLEKTQQLARACDSHDMDKRKPLVVVLRPAGPGDRATWEPGLATQDVVLAHCDTCDGVTFLDLNGGWICRRCYYGSHLSDDNKWWRKRYYRSGEVMFEKAPRPQRAA